MSINGHFIRTHLLKRVQQNVFQFSLCYNLHVSSPHHIKLVISKYYTFELTCTSQAVLSCLFLFVTMPAVSLTNRFIIYVWCVPISAFVLYKIGGSHGSGAENSGLLGCDTVSLEEYIVPPSLRVEQSKKKVACCAVAHKLLDP